ncbi:MAG TPA: CarD family transcriptional regulator [Blastocatellia bacterium]|nr:CarD family transcriptional regulator [Blastocatellia bacterium]
MKLTVGNKIVYPSQGPCLVDSVVKRIIDDRSLVFYHLVILDDQGGDLFIPVDKVEAISIRLLLDKGEVPALLEQLKKPADPGVDLKQRSSNNIQRLASGSAFDLAEIVESLTELRETKSLSVGECKKLDKAKRLLVCEVAEVMGVTKQQAEQQIDDALKARNGGVKPAPVTEKSLANASNRKLERKETAARKNRKAQQVMAQGA